MAIVQKSRKRHSDMAPLEIWQQCYLEHDGKHEYAVRDFSPWPTYFDFSKLCEGQKPVALDPEISRCPAELWDMYSGDYLATFIKSNPGRRPLPWWQWTAPGCADPNCRDTDRVKFRAAIELAQNRARWPKERQVDFLREHGLLTKEETKALP